MTTDTEVRPTSNPIGEITVWWTPDCGYLHVETNPLTIPVHCPDDVEPDDAEQGL